MASRFLEFSYPGEARPYGVIEVGIQSEVVDYIRERAATVMGGRSEHDLMRECWKMAPTWCQVLGDRFPGLAVSLRGGEGGEPQQQGPGRYGPDPGGHRSGYLGGSRRVERHYWVTLDEGELIFDPTAHQWDDRGGLDIARYRMDGKPFIDWRTRPRSPSAECVSG